MSKYQMFENKLKNAKNYDYANWGTSVYMIIGMGGFEFNSYKPTRRPFPFVRELFHVKGRNLTSQTSKMELFTKTVNGWKPLTIFAKRSILGVWLGFE